MDCDASVHLLWHLDERYQSVMVSQSLVKSEIVATNPIFINMILKLLSGRENAFIPDVETITPR
jgi:hypothetical protein